MPLFQPLIQEDAVEQHLPPVCVFLSFSLFFFLILCDSEFKAEKQRKARVCTDEGSPAGYEGNQPKVKVAKKWREQKST